MEMVQNMGEVHIVMGSVLFIFHTHGIWILQRIARGLGLPGHYWPDYFSYRHCDPTLPHLQRYPHLPYSLQAHIYCT